MSSIALTPHRRVLADLVSRSALAELTLIVGGAALMGLGIAAMHYTAMGAVTFMPGNMAFSSENTILIGTVGVVAVAVTTAIVLLGTLLTAVLDRRMYLQFSEQSERLHAMAESSMDGIYLCEALHDRNGEIFDFRIAYVNSNVRRQLLSPATT